MALPEVTYEHYRGCYGGALGEEAFNASRRAAAASVADVIGFNAPEGAYQTVAYRNAVCAAADVDAAYGASGGIGENMASVAIGAFSATLQGEGASAYDLDMRRAIRRELQGSGLLYQGIG